LADAGHPLFVTPRGLNEMATNHLRMARMFQKLLVPRITRSPTQVADAIACNLGSTRCYRWVSAQFRIIPCWPRYIIYGSSSSSPYSAPLELHLAISELWFGQEWEGILLELLC